MRIVGIVIALLLISTALFAQPSGQYLRMQGVPQHGYIEIPHDVLLDTTAMTVEAWVSVRDANNSTHCSSIAGKGYQTGWWLGLCGTTMRSYFNGTGSVTDGGVIPAEPTSWIHIAAVTDGKTRKHYVNGNLVAEGGESPRSVSTLPLRIGSDPNWDFMPEGGIDDLRIWKVARTQDQIRQTMFAPYIPEANDVSGMFQGLEAWYLFEGNAMDSWRTHHGTIIGTGVSFAAAPAYRRHAAGH
jgi:hypothetical protein